MKTNMTETESAIATEGMFSHASRTLGTPKALTESRNSATQKGDRDYRARTAELAARVQEALSAYNEWKRVNPQPEDKI